MRETLGTIFLFILWIIGVVALFLAALSPFLFSAWVVVKFMQHFGII